VDLRGEREGHTSSSICTAAIRSPEGEGARARTLAATTSRRLPEETTTAREATSAPCAPPEGGAGMGRGRWEGKGAPGGGASGGRAPCSTRQR